MKGVNKAGRRLLEVKDKLITTLNSGERYIREHYVGTAPSSANFTKARDASLLTLNKVVEAATLAGFSRRKGLTRKITKRATAITSYKGTRDDPYGCLVFAITLRTVAEWIEPRGADTERDRMDKETKRSLESDKHRRKLNAGAGLANQPAGRSWPTAAAEAPTDTLEATPTSGLLASIGAMLTAAIRGIAPTGGRNATPAVAPPARPAGGGNHSRADMASTVSGAGTMGETATYVVPVHGTVLDTPDKCRAVILAMRQDRTLVAMAGRYCICCSYLAGKPTGDHRLLSCKDQKQAGAMAYATAHPGFANARPQGN